MTQSTWRWSGWPLFSQPFGLTPPSKHIVLPSACWPGPAPCCGGGFIAGRLGSKRICAYFGHPTMPISGCWVQTCAKNNFESPSETRTCHVHSFNHVDIRCDIRMPPDGGWSGVRHPDAQGRGHDEWAGGGEICGCIDKKSYGSPCILKRGIMPPRGPRACSKAWRRRSPSGPNPCVHGRLFHLLSADFPGGHNNAGLHVKWTKFFNDSNNSPYCNAPHCISPPHLKVR